MDEGCIVVFERCVGWEGELLLQVFEEGIASVVQERETKDVQECGGSEVCGAQKVETSF